MDSETINGSIDTDETVIAKILNKSQLSIMSSWKSADVSNILK